MLRDTDCRRAICHIASAAVLFTQIAVSTHACAYAAGKLAAVPTEETLTDPGAMMPGAKLGDAVSNCDMMNETATPMSAQCNEHCRYGQQVDQSVPVAVPAAALTCLYPLPPHVPLRAGTVETTRDAVVAPSPPHTILHCCLRI